MNKIKKYFFSRIPFFSQSVSFVLQQTPNSLVMLYSLIKNYFLELFFIQLLSAHPSKLSPTEKSAPLPAIFLGE